MNNIIDNPPTLRPYQIEGTLWLAQKRSGLLADEPGLGKTAQALLALQPESRTIIVAPTGVQRHWSNQIRIWRQDLTATEVDRKDFRLPEIGEIIVARWSSLPDEPEWPDEDVEVTLILDEAHYGCNESLRRERAWDIARKASTVWMLTGTPMPNKLDGLWRMLDLGRLTWAFDDNEIVMLLADKREFQERLGLVCLRRRKADVLAELPPISYETLEVPVEGVLLRKLLNDVLQAAGGEEHTEAALMGALGEAERLRVETILMRARSALAGAKMPAVLGLVREYEAAKNKLVVFSCHRGPVRMLEDREGWGRICGDDSKAAREQAIETFKTQGDGLALTLAGGEGITLHCDGACSTMVRVDRHWSVATNEQVTGRLHRMGQTRGVRIIDIVADHVVDRIVERVLAHKAKLLHTTGLD